MMTTSSAFLPFILPLLLPLLLVCAILYFGYPTARAIYNEPPPKKLLYLEGLRGLAAMVVVVFHFLLAAYPAAISGNLEMAHRPIEAFLPLTPLYLFYSGSFSVAIFFVMSGFVLSYPYFTKKQNEIAYSGLFRRYFRLAIPVLATSIGIFLLMKSGWLNTQILQNVGITTKSNELHSIYSFHIDTLYNFTPHFVSMLSESLYNVFFTDNFKYNPVFWTIKVEFWGSLLVFGFLLLMGDYKHRWLGYGFLIFLVQTPQYLAFVLGMGLCDLMVHRYLDGFSNRWLLGGLLLLGLYLAAVPNFIDPRLIPASNYAWSNILSWLTDTNKPWFMMVLGATLLLLVTIRSTKIQHWLSLKPLLFLGKISFSLYLTHFVVLCSWSAALFLFLDQWLVYNLTALLCMVFSFPVMIATAALTYHWMDKRAIQFAQHLYQHYCKPLLDTIKEKMKQRSSS